MSTSNVRKLCSSSGDAAFGVRPRVLLGDALSPVQIDGQELPRAAQVARIVGHQLEDPFGADDDIAEPLLELTGCDSPARRVDDVEPADRLRATAAAASSPSTPRCLVRICPAARLAAVQQEVAECRRSARRRARSAGRARPRTAPSASSPTPTSTPPAVFSGDRAPRSERAIGLHQLRLHSTTAENRGGEEQQPASAACRESRRHRPTTAKRSPSAAAARAAGTATARRSWTSAVAAASASTCVTAAAARPRTGVAPSPLVSANNAWQLTMPTVAISSDTPTT